MTRARPRILRCARGFTLLEIIAVLAILGVMAGVLAPSVVRSLDEGFAAAEEQNLRELGEAFRDYVAAEKRVPGPGDWAPALAEYASLPASRVLENERRYPRRVFFDPRFITAPDTVFGGLTQVTGLTARPVSPRLMIVSNLRGAVPGIPNSSAAFAAVWDQTNAAIVVEGPMLKIERVNLASAFVRVVLSNQSGASPSYSLEASAQAAVPVGPGPQDGVMTRYVIAGTRLNLHVAPFPGGVVERALIVRADGAYRYQSDDGVNWYWGAS